MIALKQLAMATFLIALMSGVANAEVYKWQDANGKVHYSSNPPSKNAKPADLPPIMKGDVKLTNARVESCEKHGGINCQLGADTDGSVICFDGFRDAPARFRFSCSSPKLELLEVSTPDDKGAFVVTVRNSKSVVANNPTVMVKGTDNTENLLVGPKEIEAFGVGEFHYVPNRKNKLPAKPSSADVVIGCANCPD